MDENTWRLAQVIMWLVGLQTTIIIAILGTMWAALNKKFEKIDQRMDRLENRMNLMEHDMTEVKTMIRMKQSCMIQDSSQIKKAE